MLSAFMVEWGCHWTGVDFPSGGMGGTYSQCLTSSHSQRISNTNNAKSGSLAQEFGF